MSINALVSSCGRTQGWQVRVYVDSTTPRLTKFFAWKKWGKRRGYKLAQEAQRDLQVQASRMRARKLKEAQ